MEGYFAFDLIIDKDDKIVIIDTHGFSDAISRTEKAGYHPRKERVRKYMSLLKDKARGRRIVHLMGHQDQYRFSPEVNKFFKSLPKGAVHLDWVEKEFEAQKRRTPSLLKKEILLFDQAASFVKAKFHPGWLIGYSDGLYMNVFDVREMLQRVRRFKFRDVGLVVNWGNDFSQHPDAGTYWVEEKQDLRTLQTPQAYYVFNAAPKSVGTGLLRKFTDNLPDEVYIGMGRTNSTQIAEFVEKHDAFVRKPLCTHAGVDVRFLEKSQALEIVLEESKLDVLQSEIRERVLIQGDKGFETGDIDKYFSGYFVNEEDRGLLPLTDMGSYTLQGRIQARPFKSTKTGMQHTGTIRAQILFGEPIGVMHRFSSEEYKGSFQNITLRELRTFYERVDDKLEQRIVDFLNPLLTSVEEEMKKYDAFEFFSS